jgi:alcohol dehydrogenase class IV
MGAPGGTAAGSFELLSVGRIVFGRGQVARTAELAAQFGRTALVIGNAGDRGDGGATDRLAGLLAGAGVQADLVRQRGEPTVTQVDAALETARSAGCEVVIGLGGGSAMDAAKAVAGLLTNGGAAIDYMEVIGERRKITQQAAPWIAVPTTAGTGAEVTKNAVVSCPEKHFKASIRGEQLFARAAVVDPELHVAVRPDITARTGMDALCQLIESCTSAKAQPVTDALAMDGIARAARSLPRAWRDGGDLDAREDMALAALLSGITLTNAGLGAVHGFAAPLGANLPVPHGVVCAALLPHVMRANVEALRAESADHPWLARYAAVGRTLVGKAGLADADAIAAGIEFVGDLVGELGIPPLGDFGLTDEQVPSLVGLARKSSSMRYNPVALSEEILAGVLRAAV